MNESAFSQWTKKRIILLYGLILATIGWTLVHRRQNSLFVNDIIYRDERINLDDLGDTEEGICLSYSKTDLPDDELYLNSLRAARLKIAKQNKTQYGYNTYNRCIKELNDLGSIRDTDKGLLTLPPSKPSNAYIPFYILPEGLPESSRLDPNLHTIGKLDEWSQCWKTHITTSYYKKAPDLVKRSQGFYLARQLERHPWRVYDPSKALIYVVPYTDFVRTSDVDNSCRMVWPEDLGSAVVDSITRNKELLSTINTVVFAGGYMSYYDVNKSQDYWNKDRTQVSWVDASWHLENAEMADKPNRVFFPYAMGMAFPCPEGDPSFTDARGVPCSPAISSLNKQDEQMTSAEWLLSRPLGSSSFGNFDARLHKKNRCLITSAFQLLHEYLGGIQLGTEALPWPIVWIHTTIHRVLNPKSNAVGVVCSGDGNLINEDTNFDDALNRVVDDALEGGHEYTGYASAVLSLSDRNMAHMDRNRQESIRYLGKAIISLRGDLVHSQRSYEGLLYGSPTFHMDINEELFQFFTMLPRHIPWRLLGLYDNLSCVENLMNSLNGSDRFDIRFPNREPPSLLSKLQSWHVLTDQWNDRDIVNWALEIEGCMAPIAELMASNHKDAKNGDALRYFRSAIRQFSQDILWEYNDSRVAENIVFEAARMMSYARRDDLELHRSRSLNTMESLGLKMNMFKSNYPESCQIAGGPTLYEQSFSASSKDGLINLRKEVHYDVLREGFIKPVEYLTFKDLMLWDPSYALKTGVFKKLINYIMFLGDLAPTY